MLRDYFTTVCKHLVSEHAEMLSVERTNRRIMMTKGEVHVERKERAESLQVRSSRLSCFLNKKKYFLTNTKGRILLANEFLLLICIS